MSHLFLALLISSLVPSLEMDGSSTCQVKSCQISYFYMIRHGVTHKIYVAIVPMATSNDTNTFKIWEHQFCLVYHSSQSLFSYILQSFHSHSELQHLCLLSCITLTLVANLVTTKQHRRLPLPVLALSLVANGIGYYRLHIHTYTKKFKCILWKIYFCMICFLFQLYKWYVTPFT